MDVGLPKGPAFNNPPSERLDAEVLEKEYAPGSNRFSPSTISSKR
jgi:hypothetical protein